MMRKLASRLMGHFSQRERACGISGGNRVARRAPPGAFAGPWSARLRRVCCGLFMVPLLVFAQESSGNSEMPDAETFGTGNPEMLAAIAQARAGLDQFVALAETPEPGMSVFKLKAIVRDGKKLETFWITPFRAVGEDFEGVVANTPEIVGNVSLGETIRIPRAHVADWGYVRNGRQVGSFTVCVLFRYMPPETADYFRRTNGFDC